MELLHVIIRYACCLDEFWVWIDLVWKINFNSSHFMILAKSWWMNESFFLLFTIVKWCSIRFTSKVTSCLNLGRLWQVIPAVKSATVCIKITVMLLVLINTCNFIYCLLCLLLWPAVLLFLKFILLLFLKVRLYIHEVCDVHFRVIWCTVWRYDMYTLEIHNLQFRGMWCYTWGYAMHTWKVCIHFTEQAHCVFSLILPYIISLSDICLII